MIAVLSPSKTMNFDEASYNPYTKAQFQDEAWQLVKKLKRFTKGDIKDLMKISDNLTALNYGRFKEFSEEYRWNKNAKQAIFAYQGDVYTGLEAETLKDSELTRAQKNLRIISGLYGILRPLDLIQPYRLEMSRSLQVQYNKNLYEFWGDSLTENLNKDLKKDKHPLLVNLASNEYYKAIDEDKLDAPIININFRERRDGKLKFISFNAKKARGLMARYIVKERPTEKEHLQGFDYENYLFSEENSADDEYMFIKE